MNLEEKVLANTGKNYLQDSEIQEELSYIRLRTIAGSFASICYIAVGTYISKIPEELGLNQQKNNINFPVSSELSACYAAAGMVVIATGFAIMIATIYTSAKMTYETGQRNTNL